MTPSRWRRTSHRPRAASRGRSPSSIATRTVANDFVNMLGYNKDGREEPDKPGRDEGYLFQLGWLAHQTTNLQSIDDANGPMRPIFITGTCSTLTSLVNDDPAAGVRARAVAAAGDRLQEPGDVVAQPDALAARRPGAGAADEHARPDPRPAVVIAGFTLTCFGLLLFLWLAFGGRDPVQAPGLPREARVHRRGDARRPGRRAHGRREDRPGRRQAARARGQQDARHDRARQPLRAAEGRRRGDPAREDAARRDVHRGHDGPVAARPDVKEGARLPDGQVKPAVEFDELLRDLRQADAPGLPAVQASSARASAGRGRDISDALGNLPIFAENARASPACSTTAAPHCATSSRTRAGPSSRSPPTRAR